MALHPEFPEVALRFAGTRPPRVPRDVREPSLKDDDSRDKPAGRTTDSKINLGEIVREFEELATFNDEAHPIHDSRLAWFKSIQDIHHRMLQKDCRLSLQVDVTATPRHNDGAIFVQTVSDTRWSRRSIRTW